MQHTRPRTRPVPPPRTPARPASRHRPGPPFLHGRLYDVIAAATRVGVGWVFAEYGLALRGREALVTERLADSGVPAASLVAPVVPALLVALSVSFAVGLLTWLTGPLLALSAVVGTLATAASESSPFGSWGATALVTAVCVLMAVGGGRWSWDYLVLTPRPRGHRQVSRRGVSARRGRTSALSPRRPEHAPPLLYPVEQAAPRRPNRL
ncbi:MULTISPECIES: DoxX family protein [unclassified Nocardiopsis]|uniref:DoxX family protein n=1 Tax=unclassified Nocardiopsis TaxID=2649073 RepID=UPI00340CF831